MHQECSVSVSVYERSNEREQDDKNPMLEKIHLACMHNRRATFTFVKDTIKSIRIRRKWSLFHPNLYLLVPFYSKASVAYP